MFLFSLIFDVSAAEQTSLSARADLIAPILNQRVIDRRDLNAARSDFAAQLESNFMRATSKYSADVRIFIKRLFDESCHQVGIEDIALVLLGSIARDEASPYTDLECLFLVSQDTAVIRRQCHLVMQKISDRLSLAGEGPERGYKGFYCDEGGFTPPYNPWFYRYSNPGALIHENQWAGDRSMIAPVARFKDYFSLNQWCDYQNTAMTNVPLKDWLPLSAQYTARYGAEVFEQSIYYACQALRIPSGRELSFRQSIAQNWRSHCAVAGNIDLYTLLGLDDILNQIIVTKPDFPKMGMPRLSKFIQWYLRRYESILNWSVSLISIDFKYQVYRPIEQFLTGLAELYKINQSNSFLILNALVQNKVIPGEILTYMSNVLYFSMYIGFRYQFSARTHVTQFSLPDVFDLVLTYNSKQNQRSGLDFSLKKLGIHLDQYKKTKAKLSQLDKEIKSIYDQIKDKTNSFMSADELLYFYNYVRPSLKVIFDYMVSMIKY